MGIDHPVTFVNRGQLALLYEHQGRYREAESLLRGTVELGERIFRPGHPDIITSINNLAGFYEAIGRYEEAEPLYRRVVDLADQALGPDHPLTATSLNNLAYLYANQGRLDEAEPLYLRALAINEQRFGPDHRSVAANLINLGELYRQRHQFDQAEPLLQRALTINERVLGSAHPDTLKNLNAIATLYQDEGRLDLAEPLARRVLETREQMLGADHPETATALDNFAVILKTQGRYDEADPLFARALEIRRRTLGPDHPDVASTLNNWAGLLLAQDRYAEAEPLLHEASLLQRAWLADHGAIFGEDHRLSGRAQTIYTNHLRAIADFLPTAADLPTIVNAGFETGQALRFNATAQAVARMAARAASADPTLAAALRSLQDQQAQLQALDRDLVQRLSRPQQQRDAAYEAGLREDIGRLRGEIEGLNAEIGGQFKTYAALVQSQVLTAAETQTLLRPAEALLVYAVQDDQSYLWVLRSPDQAALRVLPFGRAALAERVTALRRGLDPRPGHLEPFEVAAAHALYQDILAPAAELLAGADHLIVVPDGPLESLPFAVLVTAPPPERPAGTFGRYRQAVWLGTQRAISVLPGVSALRALRATVAQPPGAEPFLGYGQPVLTGDRVPAAPAEGTAARAAAAPAPGGRRTADVERVRRLEPLTGTEDLLRTIATALGADPAGAVVTGADATVPRLRQAPLDRYRVLALATHGLLVDEARRLGLDEPGLVLTPPEVGSAEDDGVLTVGDITQLRLNADWVLLTACNTAASDGTPGAEGLSGLARAFFYAGARSLLVSHWSVNRDAAIALVTRLFPAAGQGGGKAAALQAAMTVLIADRNHPEYAHPAYWAPFIVVGEGG